MFICSLNNLDVHYVDQKVKKETKANFGGKGPFESLHFPKLLSLAAMSQEVKEKSSSFLKQ